MGRAYGGEKIEICGNPPISGVRSTYLTLAMMIENRGPSKWKISIEQVNSLITMLGSPRRIVFVGIISTRRKKVNLVSRKFEKKLSRLLVFSGENIVNLWECIMFAYGYKSWKYLMRASFALMFYPTLLKVWPISYLLKLKDVGNEIFLWTAFKLIR